MIDAQAPLAHDFFELAKAQRIYVGFILRRFPQDYCIGPPKLARTGIC